MKRAARDGLSSRSLQVSVPTEPSPELIIAYKFMKAFLLAAGHGTRLRPLTDSTPKCLVPIGGIPMLRIWLDLCRRHDITDVLVNIHSHADAVHRFLRFEPNSVRIQVSEERQLLGSAGTLKANRDWVKSESTFFVFYADVLTNTNLAQMLAFHRAQGQIATLGVYEVPDPARCGVVKADEHSIIRSFVEKPSVPESNLAFSGLLVASPQMIDFVPDETPSDLGFHVFPRLVGQIAAYRVSDYLTDIGTIENYQAAQVTWASVNF
jgi:mannose-1-phosphate guanylyltransferase